MVKKKEVYINLQSQSVIVSDKCARSFPSQISNVGSQKV